MKKRQQAGIFFPEPGGWLNEYGGTCGARLIKKARAVAKKYNFKIGGNVYYDVVDKMGGHVRYSREYMTSEPFINEGWDKASHFRNFKWPNNKPIEKKPQYKFYINLDEEVTAANSNYITAQLMAHYVLHCKDKTKKIYAPYIHPYTAEDTFYFSDEEYCEAGNFALHFLMPENEFKRRWKGLPKKLSDEKKIERMQAIFKVPEFLILAGFDEHGVDE